MINIKPILAYIPAGESFGTDFDNNVNNNLRNSGNKIRLLAGAEGDSLYNIGIVEGAAQEV